MFEDTGGVAVSLGSLTAFGHVDVAHASVAERLEVHVPVYRLSFPAGRLTGVKAGVTVTAGGSSYRIKGPVDDGFDAGVDEAWYAVKL